jgi:esterase/lipase superfamily enzyme
MFTNHLNDTEIQELIDAAVNGDVFGIPRTVWFQGVRSGFVATLQIASSPLQQFRLDLARLNAVERLEDGSVPLNQFLTNIAHFLKSGGVAEGVVFEKYANRVDNDTRGLQSMMPSDEPIKVLRLLVRVEAPPLEIERLQGLATQLIERAEFLAQEVRFFRGAHADVEFIEGSLAVAVNVSAYLSSPKPFPSRGFDEYYNLLRTQIDTLAETLLHTVGAVVAQTGAVVLSSRITYGSVRSPEALAAKMFPGVEIHKEGPLASQIRRAKDSGPPAPPKRRLKVGRNGNLKLIGGADGPSHHADEPYFNQSIFFGTDRRQSPAPVYFGTDRDELNVGHCLITVPTIRKKGTLPRESWFGAWPSKHYVLKGVHQQEVSAFLKLMNSELSKDPDGQALLYIHGFGNSFVDAAYRTAQIAADLEFKGAAAMFSWPSLGRVSKEAYFMDESQADYAIPHLAKFIELLVQRTNAKAVHVIAHSMGNRLLGNAAKDVLKGAGIRFTELVLAAPDIDADVFQGQIAPALLSVTRRTTLYMSSKDEALMKSGSYRPMSRIGDCSTGVVLASGIETIDASGVETDLVGHSYYATNKTVLGDVYYVLRGHPPSGRFGLNPVTIAAGAYWEFKP